MITPGSSGLRRLLLAVALMVSASCDPSPDPTAIVGANSREEIESLPSWTLDEEPEAAIGVLEGDPAEQFGNILRGALGPHGIYLLDTSYHQVRIFDRSGGHVMSLGREGEGPGEFQSPTGLIVGVDSTITVWDRAAMRLTVFDHDGELIRTIPVREGLWNPTLLAAGPDGSVAIGDVGTVGSLTEASVRPQILTTWSSGDELLDTVQVLDGPHTSGVDGLGKPFAEMDLMAPAREGVWVLRVDSALVVRLNLEGDTLQQVAWEPLDREITEADFQALEAYTADLISDPGRRAERIRRLRQPGFAAERHPAAVQFETDGVGRLWLVERHDWERIQSPTWLVFDSTGRVAGRWEEPLESLVLLDADETTALVRVTDDLGVQRVELRTIQKDGSPVVEGAGGR